jgi:signal transduction histidine kinase
MSHEIRTPMNAIMGMLTLLSDTALSAPQANYVSQARGAAHSLLELISNVLDLSQFDADQMQMDTEPFSVAQLLRNVSSVLSSSVGKKPLTIAFDIDPAMPATLVGDAMRLQQVLINLGGNAIKFTAAGKVVVQMRVEHVQGHRYTVRFAVIDSGVGISQQQQTQIFDDFNQGEAAFTRQYGGTGLGLTISKRLVHMMGGVLAVISEVDKGSTFHFTVSLDASNDDGLLDTTGWQSKTMPPSQKSPAE